MATLTRGTKTGLMVAAIIVILAGFTAGSYALAIHALDQSQHKWCDTLSLLTSSGPPRPGIPSYQRALEFYDHLKTLEQRFGCD